MQGLSRNFLVTFLFLFIASFAFSQNNDLAQRRAEHLRHGINASGWYAQVSEKDGYTPEHLKTFITAEDIALIKSSGFDHVRLSINPEPLFNSREPHLIPATYLGYLDGAVKMILDQGLSVVIDIHPEEDFKAKLKEDPFVEQFADFWRALAQHYSTLDADRVFFEIMNEPEVNDKYRWFGIEAKVAAAIREGAPNNTIIAAGARWSGVDELVFMDLLRDPNVIYNFHFYEPYEFTHQGATWGSYYWHWLRDVKYPSTPESAEKSAALIPDEDAADRLAVIRFGYDHWNAARIDAEINQVAEWAKRHNVPMVCNEFGAFRRYSNPNDRAAWISDVRNSLEHHGIGWAMWDYNGSFGVVTKVNGHSVADPNVLHALGLQAQANP
ncbi:MAG TPA: glycoside hydrolase family 5 protein [Terriglobales bacterium]